MDRIKFAMRQIEDKAHFKDKTVTLDEQSLKRNKQIKRLTLPFIIVVCILLALLSKSLKMTFKQIVLIIIVAINVIYAVFQIVSLPKDINNHLIIVENKEVKQKDVKTSDNVSSEKKYSED